MENYKEFLRCVEPKSMKKMFFYLDPKTSLTKYMEIMVQMREIFKDCYISFDTETIFEQGDILETPPNYSINEVHYVINKHVREDKIHEVKERLNKLFPFEEWYNNMPMTGVRRVLCNEYLEYFY